MDQNDSKEKPTLEEIKEYYSNDKIAEIILKVSKNREFVPVYSGKYGKRPDMINTLGDFFLMVEKGATSFHMSVEKWTNPLMLENASSKAEMDKLRLGWDIVLDIDCDYGYEYAKIACILVVKLLKAHGIKSVYVKFSGSRGFHIIVPSESLPKRIGEKRTSELYPELLQTIAKYVSERIKTRLSEELIRFDPYIEEMIREDNGELNPYKIMVIEENWSNRHLFRAPYSLNEKTYLVSMPLKVEEVKNFKKDMAKMENVKIMDDFLECKEPGEAEILVCEALDYVSIKERKEEMKRVIEMKNIKFEKNVGKIPKECFPPCIKNGLNGLEDGRKRFLFILLNFLKKCGYSKEEIVEIVEEWNKNKNKEPLRDSYVKAQLKYFLEKNKEYLPPNCDNKDYYGDLRICQKDSLCEKIKNPFMYAVLRAGKSSGGGKKKGKATSKRRKS